MKNLCIATLLTVSCALQAVTLDPLHSLVFLPRPGSTVPMAQPIIAGIMVDNNQKPIKNKQVTLYVDGKKTAVVQTDENGVWSYTLRGSQTLNDGCHYAQAYITLSSRHDAWSQGSLFTVRNQQRLQRSGNVSAANSAIVYPFEGSYVNTATPIVIGSLLDSGFNAVSGETVNVKVDSSTIGSPTSNSNGIFSYQSSSLTNAAHTADAHCVESSVDLTTINFTIDTVAPSAPTITTPTENETVTTSLVTVGGTTEADATITSFMDGDTYGDVSYADGSGNWSYEYELDNGPHSVTAQAADIAGNTGALSGERNFSVNA